MRKILLLLIFQIFSAFILAQSSGNSNIKLFRFGSFENEKPAVEYPTGTRLDVSAFGEDFNEKFFATNGIERLQTWLTANAKKCPGVASDERYGSCVARPSKIVAIGLNYVAHLKDGITLGDSVAIPKEPIIFLKATSALCGPFEEGDVVESGIENIGTQKQIVISFYELK